MKKILVVIPVLVVSAILSFSLYNSLDKKEVYEDTNYSFDRISMMLETEAGSKEYKEATTNEWPESGYIFNSELSSCENGSRISWDVTNKNVIFSGSLSDKCYVYFDKEVITLVNYVKSLYTGNQGDNNLYLHDASLTNGAGDGSYRFSGASEKVNNFVCFGYDSTDGTCPTDYLYRIIGVFGDNVKLIKYDYATSDLLGSDGDYSANTFKKASSSTYKGYLDIINSYTWNYKANTTINSGNGSNVWSTSLLNTTNLNTNFISNIGKNWADKIVTTSWQVGGNTWSNIGTQTVTVAYKNEITTPAVDLFESKKIGLMYASDYMYAASPTYWSLVGYNSNDAAKDYRAAVNDNWLYMGVTEWLIVPRTDLAYFAFGISSVGYVGSISAVTTLTVRPVFILNSSVTYVKGTGTQNLPFIIE